MKKILTIAYTISISLFSTSTVIASSSNICESITSQRLYDEARITTIEQQSRVVYNAFCLDEQMTINEAKDIGVDLKIPIYEVIVDFGGELNENNFSEKKKRYCETLLNAAAGDFSQSVNIKRINNAAINAFVRCVEVTHKNSGIFPYVKTHGFSTFSIIFPFNSYNDGRGYRVEGILSQPTGLVNCAPSAPFETGESRKTLLCSKPATQEVAIAINSPDGDMDTVVLPAQPDMTSRILDLEQWKGTINRNNQLLPKGAISYFANSICPNGWKVFEGARGRYVVGVPLNGAISAPVGTALGNVENRNMTNQHTHGFPHTHGYSDAVVGYKCTPGKYDGLTAEFRGTSNTALCNSPKTTGGSSIASTNSINPPAQAGTNAPYIQLLACEKL